MGNPMFGKMIKSEAKRTSVIRKDLKGLVLKSGLKVPLHQGQYFRETANEYMVYDLSGKVRGYIKSKVERAE